MRKIVKRDKTSLVDVNGFVSLAEACVRANKTGFFALQQRVAPESFDGKTTDINPKDCFFGGRRIDLALMAKDAEAYATRAAGTPSAGDTVGDDSGSGD